LDIKSAVLIRNEETIKFEIMLLNKYMKST